MALKEWFGASSPQRKVLEGRYVRLEPLEVNLHAESLYLVACAEGAEARFRYLFDEAPSSISEQIEWTKTASQSLDPMFFAVVDRQTGRAEGRQAFMRNDAKNGVIEIGSILWGPAIARSRCATEALFLFADHAFAQGYRRFEWKCHNANEPSKRAALRFGFQYEGLFRQHMVMKGENRDTAWFSILDKEWPRLREGYQRWLAPENFDVNGLQLSPLTFAEEL